MYVSCVLFSGLICDITTVTPCGSRPHGTPRTSIEGRPRTPAFKTAAGSIPALFDTSCLAVTGGRQAQPSCDGSRVARWLERAHQCTAFGAHKPATKPTARKSTRRPASVCRCALTEQLSEHWVWGQLTCGAPGDERARTIAKRQRYSDGVTGCVGVVHVRRRQWQRRSSVEERIQLARGYDGWRRQRRGRSEWRARHEHL